mgnify:CR=1 FL=1
MRKTPVQSVISFIATGLFVVPLVCCCLGKSTSGNLAKAAFGGLMPKAHEASCHGTKDASSPLGSSGSELCECQKFVGVSSDRYLISGKPKVQEFLLEFSKNVLPYQLFDDLLVSHRQLRGAYFSSSPPLQLGSIPLYLKNSILQI